MRWLWRDAQFAAAARYGRNRLGPDSDLAHNRGDNSRTKNTTSKKGISLSTHPGVIPGRGADALVHCLRQCGVRRVFTLSGNHIMPIYDAAIGSGIELVHVRHEAAAVHMADAWARLTGEVGIALVTGGPGHANAVGALYTAAMADSPVVLLSGHAPKGQAGMGAFQEMRQADIAAPLCKASWTCADDVAGDVVKAIGIAREGRAGPVHLSLPVDLLEGASQSREGRHSREGGNPTADLDDLVAQLSCAQRPLILAGPGALRAKPPGNIRGIPVVGMESPRGVKDPSLGAFAQVLQRADRVLLLGKPLDFTLKFGKAFAADCEVLHASWREGDTFPAGKAEDTAWTLEVRDAIARRPAGWEDLRTVQVLRAFQPILDSHPEAIFVCDGGEFGQWAQACLRAPHRVINGVAGSIGAALPFAVAARMARPAAPVIAVMGDGTFGFHPAEIDTAVRYGAPFVALVGNDARWNAEYQIQLREHGRTHATELLPTRYDEVARAFGGYGEHVEDVAALPGAIRRAIESRLPAVLDVPIEGLAAPEL